VSAIGLILFTVGLLASLLAPLNGSRRSMALLWVTIFLAIFVGFGLISAGVVVWLWGAMP
jgi:hypothetical protein